MGRSDQNLEKSLASNFQGALSYITSGLAVFGAISALQDLLPNLVRLSLIVKAIVAAYRLSREWLFGWLSDVLSWVYIRFPDLPGPLKDFFVVLSLIFVALNYESMRQQGVPLTATLAANLLRGLHAGNVFFWTEMTKSTRIFSTEYWLERRVALLDTGDDTSPTETPPAPSGDFGAAVMGLVLIAGVIAYFVGTTALCYGVPAYMLLLAVFPPVLAMATVYQVATTALVVVSGIVALFAVTVALFLVELPCSLVALVWDCLSSRGGGGVRSLQGVFARLARRSGQSALVATAPVATATLIVVASVNSYRTILAVLGLVLGLVGINALFLHVIDPLIEFPPDWLQELIEADPTHLHDTKTN